MTNSRLRQTGLTVLLLAGLYLFRSHQGAGTDGDRSPAPAGRPPAAPGPAAPGPAADTRIPASSRAVLEAFRSHRSHLELSTGGRVTRILPDDRDSPRHQRFLVEVAGPVTVLVAHNIDLAPKVPLAAGDSVELRGEYEWNDRGGVLHWTHRDPDGRHEAGWIRYDGRLYQ